MGLPGWMQIHGQLVLLSPALLCLGSWALAALLRPWPRLARGLLLGFLLLALLLQLLILLALLRQQAWFASLPAPWLHSGFLWLLLALLTTPLVVWQRTSGWRPLVEWPRCLGQLWLMLLCALPLALLPALAEVRDGGRRGLLLLALVVGLGLVAAQAWLAAFILQLALIAVALPAWRASVAIALPLALVLTLIQQRWI
ncbi:MAG: hypothetical protein EA402_10715 [Planctomycetota bacterium]|nr:MAG: hypothetical protein EA402_10715 [Planctomycetota bacterium]